MHLSYEERLSELGLVQSGAEADLGGPNYSLLVPTGLSRALHHGVWWQKEIEQINGNERI